MTFGDAFGAIGASTFTIELWIHATDIASEQIVLAKEHGIGDDATREGFGLSIVGGMLRFFRFPGVLQNAKAMRGLEHPIVADRWQHVVIRQSDDFTALFVDGDSVETSAPGSFTATSDPFILGASLGRPFGGSLDEVAFYTRALGLDEICAHMSAAGATCAGR